eukprot:4993273-Amphidinium_carterae.1
MLLKEANPLQIWTSSKTNLWVPASAIRSLTAIESLCSCVLETFATHVLILPSSIGNLTNFSWDSKFAKKPGTHSNRR